MRRHSPYNYAFNNPIIFTDPDGMAPSRFGHIGSNSQAYFQDGFFSDSREGNNSTSENGDPPGKTTIISALISTGIVDEHSAEVPSSETSQGEAISWDGCDCTLDEWNSMNGTNFTSHQEAYDWWLKQKQNAELQSLVSDMHAAQKPFAWFILSTGAAPFVIGAAVTAAPFLAAGAKSGYGLAFEGLGAAKYYGTSAYLSINTWAGATVSAGATLSHKYGNAIMGSRGVQVYSPGFRNYFNIDYVGAAGQLYMTFFGDSPPPNIFEK